MRTNREYKADLLSDLRTDPVYQALYLAAAQKDSREALLEHPAHSTVSRMGELTWIAKRGYSEDQL